MVAALWGLFVWKEFAGGGAKATNYLALMFLCYVLAIVLVARAYTTAS
jgi:glucose uptake protein